MNSSNYLVEILIAGISCSIWIFMFILRFSIYELSEIWSVLTSIEELPEALIIAFFLPLIYLLGVLVDRCSDMILTLFSFKNLREDHFSTELEYKHSRSIVYLNSDNLFKVIEYNRMRMRICRNWILNGIFIIIGIVMHTTFFSTRLIYFVIILLIISIVVAYISWSSLRNKEYGFLKIQSKILDGGKK